MASICRRWRLWILPVLTCLYALLIVVLVPILLVNSIKNGLEKKDQGALVGGAFVLLALPIAFYEIVQHMIYYTQPRLQKYIIRWVFCRQENLYWFNFIYFFSLSLYSIKYGFLILYYIIFQDIMDGAHLRSKCCKKKSYKSLCISEKMHKYLFIRLINISCLHSG